MKYLKPYNESIRNEMKGKSREELPKEYHKLFDLKEYIEKNSSLEPNLTIIDGVDEDYPAIVIELKFEGYLGFEITYNMFGEGEYNLSIENEIQNFKNIKEIYDHIIIKIKNFLNEELDKTINRKDKIEKLFKSIK
jgi:hypothetical protein